MPVGKADPAYGAQSLLHCLNLSQAGTHNPRVHSELVGRGGTEGGKAYKNLMSVFTVVLQGFKR